jgi:hypothetical protein
LNQENLNKRRSITPWNTSITDASKSGYGGHLSIKEIFQSIWSKKESLLHINVFASRIWLDSFQWKRRCNWIGRMNNLAFGISSMQEAIIPNRWRKSLAVAWLSFFDTHR